MPLPNWIRYQCTATIFIKHEWPILTVLYCNAQTGIVWCFHCNLLSSYIYKIENRGAAGGFDCYCVWPAIQSRKLKHFCYIIYLKYDKNTNFDNNMIRTFSKELFLTMVGMEVILWSANLAFDSKIELRWRHACPFGLFRPYLGQPLGLLHCCWLRWAVWPDLAIYWTLANF